MSHLELVIALGSGMAYIIICIILDHFLIINLEGVAARGVKSQLIFSSPVILSMLYIISRLYIIPLILHYKNN